MNKVVTYTLNNDGTIPDFILDGGYFPNKNEMPVPQDLTLVGIGTSESPGENMDQASLLSYIQSFLSEQININGNQILVADFVSMWWDNHLEIING